MWKFALLFFLLSCGSEDKTDETVNVGKAKEISKTSFSSSGIPETEPSEFVANIMVDESIINYVGPDDEETNCVSEKFLFSSMDENGFYLIDDSHDITSCFDTDNFSNFEDYSIEASFFIRAKISLEGSEIDLSSKSYKEMSTMLDKDYSNISIEQENKLIMLITGTTKGKEVSVEFIGMQNNEGDPCTGKTEEGKFTLDKCKEQFIETTTYDGKTTTTNYSEYEHSEKLNASSHKSQYYDSGQSMKVIVNNWSGTVTYKGENTKPHFSFTNGTEELEGVSIFSKVIFLDKVSLTNECSYFYDDFLIGSPSNNKCKQITINTSWNSDVSNYNWTIAASDATFSISANENNEKLTISEKEYYCHSYAGSAYLEDGTTIYSASNLILSETLLAESSDIDNSEPYAILLGGTQLCDGFKLVSTAENNKPKISIPNLFQY